MGPAVRAERLSRETHRHRAPRGGCRLPAGVRSIFFSGRELRRVRETHSWERAPGRHQAARPSLTASLTFPVAAFLPVRRTVARITSARTAQAV